MVMANLFLKPHHHLLLLLPFPSKLQLIFPHTHKHSLSFPTTHFSTTTLCYGPSLKKGTNPPQSQSLIPNDQNEVVFREEIFTRVFDLAALRVPSTECFALESRLRGHLLNWPRIRNIARVPGDDIDPDLAPLLGHQNNGDVNGEELEQEEGRSLVSLQQGVNGISEGDSDVLSHVLYRDKLAKTFNTRGFVKFRNLAKISRPSRNGKKKEKEKEKVVGVEGSKSVGKNSFAAIEVVEEGGVVDEGLRNLLGEEFGRSKWRGSTRLLLLDERYAGCGVEELPEAIKVPFL